MLVCVCLTYSLHSAGIGRTGVFIGADMGMRELERDNNVDVLKILASMRQDRGGMIQTKDQYVFLHRVSTRKQRQKEETLKKELEGERKRDREIERQREIERDRER